MKKKNYKHIHKLNFNKTILSKDKSILYTNIYSNNTGFLSLKEVEASRKVLRRVFFKKIVNIPLFQKETIYRKSKGSRMGKGVGKNMGTCYKVFKGSIIFKIKNVENINKNKFKFIKNKLSLKTSYINNISKNEKYITENNYLFVNKINKNIVNKIFKK